MRPLIWIYFKNVLNLLILYLECRWSLWEKQCYSRLFRIPSLGSRQVERKIGKMRKLNVLAMFDLRNVVSKILAHRRYLPEATASTYCTCYTPGLASLLFFCRSLRLPFSSSLSSSAVLFLFHMKTRSHV